ncbi:MAG: hypothetical protein JNJ70_23745 [Verrucomicrobiales bacterium]|nr:hypothetical protein [Verrucomicrobiales bacterium]
MKLALLALIVISSNLCGEELELGFYPAIPDDQSLSSDVIFEIERNADRTLRYNREKKFDLGLAPREFTFLEIKSFLEAERHKNLIVVWFDKTVMWNEQEFIRERTDEVVRQMRGVGYTRVVILGGHSAGVYYVADTNLTTKMGEQDGAGQPATRTESKSEGSDKPQPKSEGRTR